ncbi:hypothetical protein XELAEV_18040522mg [Xenopus laevis]|uniref:Uncharacterized protein n=1 Tax=Xenopus laevis TaxID=8355 RepID=A0A974H8W4_XENLA|nr:hypothetical protein XELAEV_18040522mg [Xenopus laevis]
MQRNGTWFSPRVLQFNKENFRETILVPGPSALSANGTQSEKNVSNVCWLHHCDFWLDKDLTVGCTNADWCPMFHLCPQASSTFL